MVSKNILEGYQSVISSLPTWGQQIVNLFLLIVLIVIYCVFIWKFHKFISHKNIFELNLNQYNKTEHPVLFNFLKGALYFLEYVVILPFLIFFWFIVFTIFLILLTESTDINNILIASATILGAIRMISYIPKYGQTLAKEVTKLFPLTLLAIQVSKLEILDFERIISQITQLPQLFNNITIYLLFIISLEIILRIIDLVLRAFGMEEIRKEKIE